MQNKKQITLKKIFDEFSNKESKCIQQEQLPSFFERLNIELIDPLIGYIFFLMKSKNNARIEFQQFSNLFTYLKVESIAELKKKIPQLRKQYQNKDVFKKVYIFLFDFYKERENSKTLPFQLAEQILSVYLKGRFKFFQQFFDYLESIKQKKPINKDTWKMIIQFQFNVDASLSNYNQLDGWPIFIDDFVNYLKEKK